MVKRLTVLLAVIAMVLTTTAAPVRPNVKQTVKLADGTTIELTLKGDEYLHYWADATGTPYNRQEGSGIWVPIPADEFAELVAEGEALCNEANAERAKRAPRRINLTGVPRSIKGQRKGLVILVNFADREFLPNHNAAFYNRFCNEVGFSDESAVGSVHDYFYDQSNGQFDITFDVVGPVTLSKGYANYGKNRTSSAGSDSNQTAMANEAIPLAKDLADFTLYDWDNTGEVDLIFLVYAGAAEGFGLTEDPDAIWPHQGSVNLTVDGKRVRTYACGGELYGSTAFDGIGTMCHEFGHCLGYPDLYGVNNSDNYGMATWDAMGNGCNNGGGHRPAGYTGYEKWQAGWITPIELTEPCDIENMKPMSENGDTYIIYNQGNKNEYYMIDNRQKTGWDAGIPASGMLIMHIDYSQNVWQQNKVNDTASRQRLTPIPADGELSTKSSSVANDVFPYGSSNTLNNLSVPAATLFNNNSDGKKFMNVSIYNITQNTDGTMNFSFEPIQTNKPGAEGAIFYESFDKCAGSGGCDYYWTGGSASIVYDNEGWSASTSHGGNQCAMFGSAMKAGKAVTPTFALNGEATLTFNCVPYGNDATELNVYLCDDSNNKTLLDIITMTRNKWNAVSLTLKGDGNYTLSFEPKKRWFLDEVRIEAKESSGIGNAVLSPSAHKTGVWSIDGRYLGTDTESLRPGLYIVNGKNIVL